MRELRGGNPGVLLDRYLFTNAEINETSAGAVLNPAGTRYYAEHTYSVILPAPFAATGGTDYWIRICANHQAPLGTVQWGGNQGTGGDGHAVQYSGDFHFGDIDDRAFALTAVPEPGLLVLFGAGISAVVAARRRLSPRS